MNNLLSYCGLLDAKIRASDKDLPIKTPNEDLPYGCNFCNMRFKKISDAKKHNLSTHSIPRPFSCKLCYKKFTQSGMKSDSEG